MHHVSWFVEPCSPSLQRYTCRLSTVHQASAKQDTASGSADHRLILLHELHELTTPHYCISIFKGWSKCSFGPLFCVSSAGSADLLSSVKCHGSHSASIHCGQATMRVLNSWVPRYSPITPGYLCAFEAYLPRRPTNFALSDRSLAVLATLKGTFASTKRSSSE